MQGEANKIEVMKQWLQKTGSPSSKIERVEFKNEAEINTLQFNDFAIRQ